MEQRGTLKSWNDDKGFGFIQPERGGEDVFVHISAMRGEQRPGLGETVMFVPGKDQQGRLRAEHMRLDMLCLDRPTIRRKPREQLRSSRASGVVVKNAQARSSSLYAKPAAIRYLPAKLLFLSALCLLPFIGALKMLEAHISIWPLSAYLAVSAISFCQYWYDKRNAQKGLWRTPESTLQFTALVCGWPGALVAQQVFRHKTRKLEFQLQFWFVVLLHQAFWADWLLLGGAYFARPLRALLGA